MANSGGLTAEAGDFFHRNEKGETIPIEKLVIHKPLKWTGPIFAEHLAFLKSITTCTLKMTVPSPIVLHFLRSWSSPMSDLRVPPGNRLEALKGNRAGQYSIRVNDQFRVCFRWTVAGAEDVEIVDYH